MMERLFLDRVDMGGDDFAVNLSEKLPSLILPDAANAKLSLGNLTPVAAEEAGNLSILEQAVEHGFLYHSSSLKPEALLPDRSFQPTGRDISARSRGREVFAPYRFSVRG